MELLGTMEKKGSLVPSPRELATEKNQVAGKSMRCATKGGERVYETSLPFFRKWQAGTEFKGVWVWGDPGGCFVGGGGGTTDDSRQPQAGIASGGPGLCRERQQVQKVQKGKQTVSHALGENWKIVLGKGGKWTPPFCETRIRYAKRV